MSNADRQATQAALEKYHNATQAAAKEYEAMRQNLDPVRLHDARIVFEKVDQQAYQEYLKDIGVTK
jgi:hypothetical protein